MKPRELIEKLSKYKLYEIKDIIKHEFNMEYCEFLLKDSVLDISLKYDTDMPLAYILGHTSFLGNTFKVNEDTLIPRIESEEIIIKAIKEIKSGKKVLDMCCGSGVLGITIALNCEIDLTLSDISCGAIKVTKENLSHHGINAHVIESDLFNNINGKFDYIIFNPPYVSRKEVLENSVYNYEPHLALFAENDGLYLYEEFFKVCEEYLNEDAVIFLEIGAGQFSYIKNLTNRQSTLITDMFSRERGMIIR